MKRDRWYTRTCVVCEKDFAARGHNTKYCPECRAAGKRAPTAKKSGRGNTKKPAMSLTECAIKAKELGMTYGEYVANMQAPKVVENEQVNIKKGVDKSG